MKKKVRTFKNMGARQWASSMPNMLNVAVTRAKRRLYVFGNRENWGNCRYFDEMAKVLPVMEYKAADWGKLFLRCWPRRILTTSSTNERKKI